MDNVKEESCWDILSVRRCVQCNHPVEPVMEEPLCEECFSHIVNWARYHDLFGLAGE